MDKDEIRLECLRIAQEKSDSYNSVEDIVLDANILFQYVIGSKKIIRGASSEERELKKNMKEAKP